MVNDVMILSEEGRCCLELHFIDCDKKEVLGVEMGLLYMQSQICSNGAL